MNVDIDVILFEDTEIPPNDRRTKVVRKATGRKGIITQKKLFCQMW